MSWATRSHSWNGLVLGGVCPPKSPSEKEVFVQPFTTCYKLMRVGGGHFDVSPPWNEVAKLTLENQMQTLQAHRTDPAFGRGQHTSHLPLQGLGGSPAYLCTRTSCPNRLARGSQKLKGCADTLIPARGWDGNGSKSVWVWDEKSELHSENFKARHPRRPGYSRRPKPPFPVNPWAAA